MNEEFVSYEEALALKDLGFNESVLGYFNLSYLDDVDCETPSDSLISYDVWLRINGDTEISFLKAPTYHQAFDWIYEKYGLHLVIKYWGDDELREYSCRYQRTWSKKKKKLKVTNPPETHLVTVSEGENVKYECLKCLIELIKQENGK